MEISTNRTHSLNEVRFRGTVRPSFLYKDCAKEYAKTIKVDDGDWYNLRMFVNTIKAVKNDGTQKELWVDTLESSDGKLWGLRYGEYFKRGKTEVKNQNKMTPGERMALGKAVFNQVVDFGADYFGKKSLKAPIEEFAFVDNQLKIANVLYGKSRLPENKNVEEKLLNKAAKSIQKAKDAAFDKKMEVLTNL